MAKPSNFARPWRSSMYWFFYNLWFSACQIGRYTLRLSRSKEILTLPCSSIRKLSPNVNSPMTSVAKNSHHFMTSAAPCSFISWPILCTANATRLRKTCSLFFNHDSESPEESSLRCCECTSKLRVLNTSSAPPSLRKASYILAFGNGRTNA
jgi:hypothetical protein